MPWLDALRYLRVVHLEQQPQLPRNRVADLRDLHSPPISSTPPPQPPQAHLVPRTPNLDEAFRRHRRLLRLQLRLSHLRRVKTRVMRVLGRPSREVRLMLLPLSVCEVRPLVRVQGEAKSTF